MLRALVIFYGKLFVELYKRQEGPKFGLNIAPPTVYFIWTETGGVIALFLLNLHWEEEGSAGIPR